MPVSTCWTARSSVIPANLSALSTTWRSTRRIGEPVVTAILTGQVLFTRIFGGRPPRAKLVALAWHDVDRIGTSIHLRPAADLTDNQWVEHWLRDHIIGRIPGGRHAAEHPLGAGVQTTAVTGWAPSPMCGAR